MRILIIGCGYIGSVIGQKLAAEGHTVIGVTRSGDSAGSLDQLGVEPRTADCSMIEGARFACHGGADVVIFCVSSRGGDYRKTYVEGMRCVLHAIEKQPPQLFLYTGSASVYAQATGEWVVETSPTEPSCENGQLLLETERLLTHVAQGRFTARILRSSGIYGPGRHAMLDQLRDGAETLPVDGGYWINRVHRDDVVSAIMLLAKSNIQNPTLKILNVSDNTPVLQRDYVGWLCEQWEQHMSHYAPEARPEVRCGALRKKRKGRGTPPSNRRISNQALRSLGWTPKYPDYQTGLLEIMEHELGIPKPGAVFCK